MALTVAELRAVMSADVNPFMAGMKKLDGIPGRMARIGKGMTMYLSLPLIAAAGYSIHLGNEFETAMLKIHTQAGGSMRDVKVLSRQVMELGTHAQQGPIQLADALFHLKSVGMSNVSAMRALRQASHLAAVGGADLEQTTNALAGAWRSGIKGAHSFKGAVATLNAIIGAGNMRMDDLVGAMGTGFLAAAKTFGLSLKDVGAALALMTDEGIPATVAATRLRMAFSLLGAPSKAAEKQLKSIGLTGLELAQTMRKPQGLMRTIQLLHDHLENAFPHQPAKQAQLLSRAFGGGRSSAAIMTLINNLSVLHQKEKQIEGTAKTSRFGDAVAKQAQTAQAKIARMKARLQDVGIIIRNDVMPAFAPLVAALSNAANWFAHLSPRAQKIIVMFAGLVAVAGPLLMIVGGIAGGIEALGGVMAILTSPITLVVAALVALGIFLAHNKKAAAAFGKVIKDVGHWVKTQLWPVLQQLAHAVLHAVEQAVNHVADALRKHPELWHAVQIAAHLLGLFLTRVLVPALIWLASHVLPHVVDGLVFTINAFHAVAQAGKWMWNHVLQPIFHFLVDAIGHVMLAWGKMLGALGHVPGFGWAKAAARSMNNAGHQALALAAAIRKIPDHKSVGIDVHVDVKGAKALQNLGIHASINNLTPRASGGNVRAGMGYMTGENGREWFVPNVNGRIVSNAELRALAARRQSGDHVAEALLRKLAAAGPRVQLTQRVTPPATIDTRALADVAAERLIGALASLGVTP